LVSFLPQRKVLGVGILLDLTLVISSCGNPLYLGKCHYGALFSNGMFLLIMPLIAISSFCLSENFNVDRKKEG
jgi:hypothetical protein